MTSRLEVLLTLFVGSTLSAATKAPEAIPPLRPPGGEIPPGFWEAHGVAVSAGALLVIVLAGLAVWLLARRRPVSLPPAETLARRALEPLRRQPEGGAVLIRVSQVLRHYLTVAFSLPPGELTSAEFCLLIGEDKAIGPELAADVTGFLRRCDERKFAPANSPPALGAVDQALALIKQAEIRRELTKLANGVPTPVLGPPTSDLRAPDSALRIGK